MVVVNDGNPETPYLGEGCHRLACIFLGNANIECERWSDIDRITFTTPSAYSTRQLQTNNTCPFANCDSSTGPTTSSGTPSGSGSASGTAPSATQTGAASRRYSVPLLFKPFAYLDALLSLQYWGLGAMAQEVDGVKVGSTDGHTNNWAVLVCTSRYWFNYRVSLAARSAQNISTDYAERGCSTWQIPWECKIDF